MPDVQGRIEELRSEGEAAIASASDAATLEEVRVRYLGRKAELTGILRGIAELPADQRGPVGSAANGHARRWRRRARPAGGRSKRTTSSGSCAPTRST